MLTIEKINNDEKLKGLDDEVKQAIATLSENDEKISFNERFSAIHNELDKTVEEASGEKKGGTEKTSEFIKRVIKATTDNAAAQKAEVERLKGENADLNAKIEAGSADRDLIASQKATIADLQGKYNDLKTESDKAKAAYEKQMLDIRIDNELSKAMDGLEFKEGFNEAALLVIKEQAKSQVKAKHPEFGEDGKLTFKDDNGVVLYNKANGLNPYTAQELLKESLATFDVLGEGRNRGGAGGKGGKGGNSGTLDLGGCSTKTEAMDAIAKHLSALGIARSDPKWDTEMDRLWNENHDVIETLN